MTATTEDRTHRGFELIVQPTGGAAAMALVETNGQPDNRRRVATLSASRYDKAADVVADALASSGLKPSTVTSKPDEPLALREQAGVRLALALAVIDGIRKPGRTRALIDGVNRLSDEECLYWYAAALSDTRSASRRLRALRLYLADD